MRHMRPKQMLHASAREISRSSKEGCAPAHFNHMSPTVQATRSVQKTKDEYADKSSDRK